MVTPGWLHKHAFTWHQGPTEINKHFTIANAKLKPLKCYEIHQSPAIWDTTLLLQWVGELEMYHEAKLQGNSKGNDSLKKVDMSGQFWPHSAKMKSQPETCIFWELCHCPPGSNQPRSLLWSQFILHLSYKPAQHTHTRPVVSMQLIFLGNFLTYSEEIHPWCCSHRWSIANECSHRVIVEWWTHLDVAQLKKMSPAIYAL